MILPIGKTGLKNKLFLLFICDIFFGMFTSAVKADSGNQYITIVNPVRINDQKSFTPDGLAAEYAVVHQSGLPATWLVTYDILDNNQALRLIRNFDTNQEIGVFLEVTGNFANKSQVIYHKSGSWHFANSVLLTGYSQADRIKLIDTIFAKYKAVFLKYPSSVGAWWIDAFSLDYMQRRYGVTANLGCADQFSTDNYQLWGQYWSTPYYPSKLHAGVPASTSDSKLDVVTMQWAARDPQLGYQNSLYSTQDYFTTPEKLDIGYFEKLVRLYASQNSNKFGQITLGLEGDFPANIYTGNYYEQLQVVKKLQQEGYSVLNMAKFAGWYRQEFSGLSPTQLIQSDQASWYQSPSYRVGVIANKIVDFRIYGANIGEPYYVSLNGENTQHINIPAVIDSLDNGLMWDITGSTINFSDHYFTLTGQGIHVPSWVKNHPGITIKNIKNGLEIWPSSNYLGIAAGHTFTDWTPEAMHAARSPKFWLNLILGKQNNILKKQTYFVSQEELSALAFLSTLPNGRVLVVDRECLQCSWHSKFEPAVFGNHRNYVQNYSKKPIIYNKSVFLANDRMMAKKYLKTTGALYIYLVKYEDYIEKMPFSPGDLGVEKIYENANSQIWQVN